MFKRNTIRLEWLKPNFNRLNIIKRNFSIEIVKWADEGDAEPLHPKDLFPEERSPEIDVVDEITIDEPKVIKKGKKKNKSKIDNLLFSKVNADRFKLKSLKGLQHHRIPKLRFGLERALFNPGVTYLKDPNSGVYNFPPYLSSIIDSDKFDFDKIIGYTPASHDIKFQEIAKENKKKYIATTSSITSLLCHFSFIITNWRPFDTSFLGKEFETMSRRYSKTLTFPATIRLSRHEGELYSINADKTFDKGTNILSKLGFVLERMLTQSSKEFEQYFKDEEQETKSEILECEKHGVFNYAFFNQFALRSQLDCWHPWLPNKVFDLKSRGTLPIRLDKENYRDYTGYKIKHLFGKFESFEREYYDLMRSAFMKYNYQVRIGNMDGCFLAYHNTSQMFGFQYISLKEMDQRLFGSSQLGHQTFGNSLQLLERVLDTLTQKYPDRDMLLTFKSMQGSLILDIYAEFYTDNVPEHNHGDQGIKVDPTNPLAKFQLVCYSELNQAKVLDPISLNSSNDKWDVRYHLREVEMDPLDLYNEYVRLRYYQLNYFGGDRTSLPIMKAIKKGSTHNESDDKDGPVKVLFKRTTKKKTFEGETN